MPQQDGACHQRAAHPGSESPPRRHAAKGALSFSGSERTAGAMSDPKRRVIHAPSPSPLAPAVGSASGRPRLIPERNAANCHAGSRNASRLTRDDPNASQLPGHLAGTAVASNGGRWGEISAALYGFRRGDERLLTTS